MADWLDLLERVESDAPCPAPMSIVPPTKRSTDISPRNRKKASGLRKMRTQMASQSHNSLCLSELPNNGASGFDPSALTESKSVDPRIAGLGLIPTASTPIGIVSVSPKSSARKRTIASSPDPLVSPSKSKSWLFFRTPSRTSSQEPESNQQTDVPPVIKTTVSSKLVESSSGRESTGISVPPLDTLTSGGHQPVSEQLQHLIDRLIFNSDTTDNEIRAFFLVHELFISPLELFDYLETLLFRLASTPRTRSHSQSPRSYSSQSPRSQFSQSSQSPRSSQSSPSPSPPSPPPSPPSISSFSTSSLTSHHRVSTSTSSPSFAPLLEAWGLEVPVPSSTPNSSSSLSPSSSSSSSSVSRRRSLANHSELDQFHVVFFLKNWIGSRHGQAFNENKELAAKLDTLIERTTAECPQMASHSSALKDARDAATTRWQTRLAQRHDRSQSGVTFSTPGPEGKVFRQEQNRLLLATGSSSRSAQFLSLVEFDLFCNITSGEFLACLNPDRCPNARRSIDHYNEVSQWVLSTVLLDKKPGRAIAAFIKIATELSEMYNFNTLSQIVAALKNPALTRLPSAWETVSEEQRNRLSRLSRLMAPQNNFSKLRARMARAKKVFAPPLFLVSRDLLAMKENNPVITEESAALPLLERQVCWPNLLLRANLILSMCDLQDETWPVKEPLPDDMRAFILDPLPRMSEARTWEVSASILPLPAAIAPEGQRDLKTVSKVTNPLLQKTAK